MTREKKLARYLQLNSGLAKRLGMQVHAEKNHDLGRTNSDRLTRRELLSAGFYASAYSLFLPSPTALLFAASEASAQSQIPCLLENVSCGTPFAQINFSGGRNLWGHGIMLGMRADGQAHEYRSIKGSKDSDYFAYGASPDIHPRKFEQLDLGGHPFLPYHYMYTTAEAVFGSKLTSVSNDLTIMSFCARSPDDSSSTLQNMLPIVANMRGKAEFQVVSNDSGTSLSGLSSMPAFSGIEVNANVVSDPNISALIETGLPPAVGPDLKRAYIETVYDFLSHKVSENAVKEFFCSREAAKKKLDAFAQELNPHKLAEDPIAMAMRDFFPSDSQRLGTIAYMLSNGLALSGGMNFGGFDYHDQTASGFDRDVEVFTNEVWPLVGFFHQVGKPLLILLTSDGSTRCTGSIDNREVSIAGGSTANLPLGANNGDEGRHGGAVLIALNPGNGRINIGRGQQVGHGTPEGIAGGLTNLIGDYQNGNYQKVVFESIRRLMSTMSPACSQIADFQKLTGGLRFDASLEPYVPKIG